jgi:hypothetical protein
MSQPSESISTRISHRFTSRRGWLHGTSVQITKNFDPMEGGDFPPDWYGPLLARWVEKADIIGRTEAQRRNERDGWKPQEGK